MTPRLLGVSPEPTASRDVQLVSRVDNPGVRKRDRLPYALSIVLHQRGVGRRSYLQGSEICVRTSTRRTSRRG